MGVNLAVFIPYFRLRVLAKEIGLSQHRLGRRNCFSPSVKIALMVLKAYTEFSDRLLVEHLKSCHIPTTS